MAVFGRDSIEEMKSIDKWMGFSIQFEGFEEIEDEDTGLSETYLSGVICLGEFREEFASSLSYWSRDDYEDQWREGIKRILSGDSDTSAIIVDIMSPDRTGSTLTWWPMYLDGNSVCFQMQIVMLDRLPQGFRRRDLYSHIQPRYVPRSDPSDLPPSEWVLEKSELEEWIAEKG
jgi:hypothetical protein